MSIFYEIEFAKYILPYLLRRLPWKILIHFKYKNSDELCHIKQLAIEKGIPIEISKVDLGNYKACGIIRNLSDT